MFSHKSGPLAHARWIVSIATLSAFSATAMAQELAAPLPPLPTPPQMPAPATSQTSDGYLNPSARPGESGASPSSAEPLVHHIRSANERMELTVNSSRIITLDQPIPRVVVANPSIVEATPLSPNEVQVMAKKAGATQVNLFNDKGQTFSIDCIVFGDARELNELLRAQFPAANIHVWPMQSSVLLTGFVDRADQVAQIIQIAQDYYPKVIPDIRVGGVQQVLLHVKVAEVSRTRLRALGFDFGNLHGDSFAISSIGGLISSATGTGPVNAIQATGADTARFGIVDGSSGFFAFLEALRRESLLKILSDPTLVTVSGRPAFFNSGGEFPILVPQSLGTVSIDYKKFGTQLDFVPIVLGNGNIRLEVRPRVSEIDNTRSITVNGTTVPGLRVREADTGVEMKAGQTLAIAGLVQTRLEGHKQEIPWLGELPYVGSAFRRVRQETEEVELLILVRPEIVEALDCGETPQCYPGMHSDEPNDCQLYWKGYMEVPSKGPCGPCGCGVNGEGGLLTPEDTMMRGGLPTPAPESISPGAASPSAMNNRGATSRTTANASNPRFAPANAENRYNSYPPQNPRSASLPKGSASSPGLVGPVGYDVLN